MENVEQETSLVILGNAFGETGLAELKPKEKAQYTQLAVTMAGERDGFEEVASAWRPAVIRITQAMSSSRAGKPDTAKLGDLFYKGGLLPKPLNVAVVYAWPTRVRFAPDDEVPSCSSENVDLRGRNEKDKSVSIYGDNCNVCPFEDQPFRNGRPTNCNNVMNVLMVPDTLENIFVMQFQKTGWQAGKQLVDLATIKNPPWSRFFALDTDLVKRRGGGGQYAIPTVTPVDATVTPVPDHMQKFCKMLSGHFKEGRLERRSLVIKRANEVSEQVDMETMGAAQGGQAGKSQQDFSDGM